MISIVTPWRNCPELIPAYETAVKGAHVIIVDNGSDSTTAAALCEMVTRLNGVYIRNETNAKFARANNQGLEAARGDWVVFLNSDIEASGPWLDKIEALEPGALYSPSMGTRYVDGAPVCYLEGWCLIGRTSEVRMIGGWNDKDFPGLYWEDNEFCWRAGRAGLSLRTIRLPLHHLNNYTTNRTPGALADSERNRETFERIVREARQ